MYTSVYDVPRVTPPDAVTESESTCFFIFFFRGLQIIQSLFAFTGSGEMLAWVVCVSWRLIKSSVERFSSFSQRPNVYAYYRETLTHRQGIIFTAFLVFSWSPLFSSNYIPHDTVIVNHFPLPQPPPPSSIKEHQTIRTYIHLHVERIRRQTRTNGSHSSSEEFNIIICICTHTLRHTHTHTHTHKLTHVPRSFCIFQITYCGFAIK